MVAPGAAHAVEVDFVLNGGRVRPDAAVEERIHRIAAEFGAQVRIHKAREGSELRTLASRAVAGPSHTIVAGGGDGSVSAVASVLTGTDCPLGVLPLGTLNHFAKDLKIPLDIDDAIRTVFSGRVTRVDVGEVNGRVFLNNSSLGLYPKLVHLRERQQQGGSSKWVAFARSLVAVMRHYSRVRISLSSDEQGGKPYDTPFLFVGNNRYEVTGLEIGSRTALDGGTLWVCMAPRAGPADLLAIGMRALVNRLRSTDIDVFDARDLLVSTRHRRLEVSADGEVVHLDAPLRYRSRPKALSVVVPARPEEGREGLAASADRQASRSMGAPSWAQNWSP